MKKFLFLFLFLVVSSCTEKSYTFAKYAVNTGFDIAEEAGAFKERKIVIKQNFKGDTLFFYSGINKYLIIKSDTAYTVVFTPSRKNLQDTALHFIKRKKIEANTVQE
jgi:hypothetical protein